MMMFSAVATSLPALNTLTIHYAAYCVIAEEWNRRVQLWQELIAEARVSPIITSNNRLVP